VERERAEIDRKIELKMKEEKAKKAEEERLAKKKKKEDKKRLKEREKKRKKTKHRSDDTPTSSSGSSADEQKDPSQLQWIFSVLKKETEVLQLHLDQDITYRIGRDPVSSNRRPCLFADFPLFRLLIFVLTMQVVAKTTQSCALYREGKSTFMSVLITFQLILLYTSPHIMDTNSTNGTSLNGTELIAGQYNPLRKGDKVSFGCSTRVYRVVCK